MSKVYGGDGGTFRSMREGKGELMNPEQNLGR